VLFHPPGGAPPPPMVTGTVTGTITNAGSGTPVAGATVTLSPLGRTTTSAANGTYTFSNVPEGSYTVSASTGGGLCGGGSASAPVTVSSGTSTVNLTLTQGADAFGYTCTAGPRTFMNADTVLALTGDDRVTQVTLPFPIKLYGVTYGTAWVDTNGKVSFVDPGGFQAVNTTLPTTAAPNATAYPFWDDLVVDGSASVRTTVTGSAPNRAYVVEWRNVYIYGNTSRRLTAEAVFYENGDIAFAYAGLDNSYEQGSSATVGIENQTGTIAFQYSANQAVLVSGGGVLFHPPA
jgi:Carboxypeptidase regulatory-like domain